MRHRITLILVAVLSAAAYAQDNGTREPARPSLNVLDQLDLGGAVGRPRAAGEVQLSGRFQILKESREGQLSVTAEITPNWHIYSLTQIEGGPQKSELHVAESDQFEVTGPFRSNQLPEIKPPGVFPVPSEELRGQLTWTAPLRLAEGTDPAALEIDITFSGQVCEDEGVGSGRCIPISDQKVTATFAGYQSQVTAPAEEGFRPTRTHAQLWGHVEPSEVAPGGTVKLVFTVVPDSGWHVYADTRFPVAAAQATVAYVEPPPGWHASQLEVSHDPVRKETPFPDEPFTSYYDGPVRWTLELTVPEDAEAGEFPLRGTIGLQTCTDETCDVPAGAQLTGTVTVGQSDQAGTQPIQFAAAGYPKPPEPTEEQLAGDAPAGAPTGERQAGSGGGGALDFDNLEVEETIGSDASLLLILPMAFLAGFILNFMPCVLPVIGLKIMSFVQQAGESRARVFTLNLWYVGGLMSVFLILATLAVVTGLGWGNQFNSVEFNVVLTAVVFAFALSFLGVWEIPLPGFVSGGNVQELASNEGASGAFFKGVLTTVLATPCSGPLLTPALTWAIKQPPAIAYLAFTSVGLGMAFPYLLIGAFPKLVAFLPKPGAWMDTFKHIMGFVLLGTVVALLTFVPQHYVLPIVAFLMGIWAALWWIGRVPTYDPLPRRLHAWIQGTAFAAIVGAISFGWLAGIMEGRMELVIRQRLLEANSGQVSTEEVAVHANELPWRLYSLDLLQQLIREKKTVFIDFTSPT